MRWILIVLTIAALAMHGKLWLTDEGFSKTRDLRMTVVAQRNQNQTLQDRNAALEAEVLNLKNGHDAAEERARTDLGMIGQSETFYQVIPGRGAKMVADARPF